MKLFTSSDRCILLVLATLFPYSVIGLSMEEKTLDSIIGQIPGLDGLNTDFYNIFTSFLNQTRATVPNIAHHSNFTLIQLGLLGAIGAMAAGAATIVAEAVTFRQHETDLENYKRLTAQHMQHRNGIIPEDSYGQEDPQHLYGRDLSISTPPVPNLDTSTYTSNPYNIKRRSKRSNGASTFSYPQIVKSYDNDQGHHSPMASLQQIYDNVGNIPFQGLQGASSSLQFQSSNPFSFNQNYQGLQGLSPSIPAFNQNYKGQQGLGSAFLNYPKRRSQLGTSKHGGPLSRTRDPSSFEEIYRGLPIGLNDQNDNPDYRSDFKRKLKRNRKEMLDSTSYDTRGTGFNRRNGKHSHLKIRHDDSFDNYSFYNVN